MANLGFVYMWLEFRANAHIPNNDKPTEAKNPFTNAPLFGICRYLHEQKSTQSKFALVRKRKRKRFD